MCLDSKRTYEKQKEWLKNKPKTITAYKVVKITKGRVSPPIFDAYGPYKKTNIIDTYPRIKTFYSKGYSVTMRKYQAAFHLFLTKRGAEAWRNKSLNQIILKCSIPKKSVVAIGKQCRLATIVAKEFTFVEGDKYFKKEKQCA